MSRTVRIHIVETKSDFALVEFYFPLFVGRQLVFTTVRI
jgi:hypothetical protein